MKKIELKLGSGKVSIELPAETMLLESNPPSFGVDREKLFRNLDSSANIKPGDRVAVILSDKTRLCGYPLYLPWLTGYLEDKGVRGEDITFFIAYGTHPAQTDEESLNAYGETFRKYRFVHHDCDDSGSMTECGVTSRGTRVMVRKEVFNTDHLILFGAVSHHYFAGYGGGRKLIFPGLAARNSIYQNHKLFIDFRKGTLHPGCQSGELKGNPVAEDLEEIDRMMPPKIIISGILDTSGNVARLLVNNSYDSFVETCRVYDAHYRYPDRRQFDTVVASAGGYPKDINFIQTHKSLHNAASFVKDGGTLILLGECRDGIGNKSFLPVFKGGLSEIAANLAASYSGNGGTAMATITKTGRIKVYMVTSLSEEECRIMGITRTDAATAASLVNPEGNTALILNASIIF